MFSVQVYNLCFLLQLYLKSILNCVRISKDFHLKDTEVELEEAPGTWQNISMEVLNTTAVSPPPQKRKKRQVLENHDS